jgi:hypothetical protein
MSSIFELNENQIRRILELGFQSGKIYGALEYMGSENYQVEREKLMSLAEVEVYKMLAPSKQVYPWSY